MKMDKFIRRKHATTIFDKATLRNAIKYLKIIEDMQKTNPDWYMKEFRKHEDWSIGLTHTIFHAERWLGSEYFVGGEEE